MVMRLIATALVAAGMISIVGLVGCGSIDGKDPERPPGEWRAITVPAPDGRPVSCIVAAAGRTGNTSIAISCDWAHR